MAGAGGGDDERAAAVQDEVLVRGLGEQAARLVNRLAHQPGQAPGSEADRPASFRGIHRVVARVGRGDGAAAHLPELDRAGDRTVAATGQAVVAAVVAVVDEDRPGSRTGRRRPHRSEVKDLLLRDPQRRQVHQALEQRGDPGARRDDRHRRGDRSVRGRDGHAVPANDDALGPRAEADVGAPRPGEPQHRGHRAVGVEHPGGGVVHDRASRAMTASGVEGVEVEAGPALGRFPRPEQVGRDAAGLNDRAQSLRVAARPVVDAPGEPQELLARILLQSLPRGKRPGHHPHVQPVGVGVPEDPRAAVRTAALVPGRERLQHHDRPAPGRCRPGGRRPGQSGPDDDQIRASGAASHAATIARAPQNPPRSVKNHRPGHTSTVVTVNKHHV